jgi:hypothetical protein
MKNGVTSGQSAEACCILMVKKYKISIISPCNCFIRKTAWGGPSWGHGFVFSDFDIWPASFAPALGRRAMIPTYRQERAQYQWYFISGKPRSIGRELHIISFEGAPLLKCPLPLWKESL